MDDGLVGRCICAHDLVRQLPLGFLQVPKCGGLFRLEIGSAELERISTPSFLNHQLSVAVRDESTDSNVFVGEFQKLASLLCARLRGELWSLDFLVSPCV